MNPLIFNWRGLKANEFVSGELEATSRDEAVFKLKAEGVIVTDIHGGLEEIETKITKAQKPSFFKKKIKEQDLLLFTRKFATMIQAGLAIVPALNMLTRQSENPSLTEILEEVVSKVNAGIPLSKAIEVYPHLFDNVYISLIKAGEVGGSIDIFLKKIATNLAKKLKIIRGLKAALMYPIALLTVAVIVVSVMMVYVVPVFVEIFGAGGVELPLPTRIVMSISDFFRSYYMVGLIALIFFTFQSFKRTLKNNVEFRKKVHKNNLKLPVVGKLIENSIMARL